MTIQIEEIRAGAAINASYAGDLGGLLSEFYYTGGGDPDNVLEGLEPEWFTLMGYTGDLHDQWEGFLTTFYGFTGDLLAGVQLEADARNLFPQTIDTSVFAILLENGDFLLTETGFHILNN